jgi:hypothetical protein
MSTARNLFHIGTRGLALAAVVRQIRHAQKNGDRLLLLDAVVNALAVVIAILIIVRELRERSGDKGEAVEEAPV